MVYGSSEKVKDVALEESVRLVPSIREIIRCIRKYFRKGPNAVRSDPETAGNICEILQGSISRIESLSTDSAALAALINILIKILTALDCILRDINIEG